MAATYSAFMTTRYYSPVFNTALFDGPFRIYFSQSYESSALKMYHLLQTDHADLWLYLKQWSATTKEHVFLLIYPETKDVEMVFDQSESLALPAMTASPCLVHMESWDEGVAIGLTQPQNESDVQSQIEQIEKLLHGWVHAQKKFDVTV